jgi:hypothetical protein
MAAKSYCNTKQKAPTVDAVRAWEILFSCHVHLQMYVKTFVVNRNHPFRFFKKSPSILESYRGRREKADADGERTSMFLQPLPMERSGLHVHGLKRSCCYRDMLSRKSKIRDDCDHVERRHTSLVYDLGHDNKKTTRGSSGGF